MTVRLTTVYKAQATCRACRVHVLLTVTSETPVRIYNIECPNNPTHRIQVREWRELPD